MYSRTGRFTAASLLLALAGCGPEPEGGSLPSETGFAAAHVGVQVSGTIAAKPETRDALLAFAFTELPPHRAPGNAEPTSISGVGPEGEFVLTAEPSQRLTVVILHDTENDGVIDPGDPIAVLDDPENRLIDLGDGDTLDIHAISLDFKRNRAVAESIDVSRLRTAAPATAETD